MPEGDTIFRSARGLRRVLVGKQIRAFEASAMRPPETGTSVTSVEARGKHLLIWLSDNTAIHTHMGMHGSWHIYRCGSRWQRGEHEARIRIDVDDWTAVCFNPAVAERLREAEVAVHPRLSRLGPDLCDPGVDLSIALARLAARPQIQIGAALMDQTIASGIGNVYKSETLFVEAVDPFAPVGAISASKREQILRTASRLLRSNLDTAVRITNSTGRMAVYDRSGRDCPRCAGTITMRHQGQPPRSTYWCASCQTIGSTTERSG